MREEDKLELWKERDMEKMRWEDKRRQGHRENIRKRKDEEAEKRRKKKRQGGT